jgi:hypothetical protein
MSFNGYRPIACSPFFSRPGAMLVRADNSGIETTPLKVGDRTQPGLPMKNGRCGTMTHDYKRHGTMTLFAALDVLGGRVIGQWTMKD